MLRSWTRLNIPSSILVHRLMNEPLNLATASLTYQNAWLRHNSTYNMPDMKTDLNKAKEKQQEQSKQQESNKKPKSSRTSTLLTIFAAGAVTYFAASYILDRRTSSSSSNTIDYSSPHLPGKIKPTISNVREKNPGGVKLTLYQYVTCPFCCKVRAYLDYYGYSYDIVEVNSISKKQIDWSGYKKVPILAVQFPSNNDSNNPTYEDNIVQLNDSSLIISALETFRLNPSKSLKEIVTFYDPVVVDSGKEKQKEYPNRYFLMFYDEKIDDGKSMTERKMERDWRSWVDASFVHAISPNVYRSYKEAYEAFRWFEEVGDWKSVFSQLERSTIIYTGSFVMYLLGGRLRKKYNLKENVRESLYDFSNEWTSSFSGSFRGGSEPDLSDLALYGAIGSFRGTESFKDMMDQNPKMRTWYQLCKEYVENSRGGFYLNNPSSRKKSTSKQEPAATQATKSSKKFYLF